MLLAYRDLLALCACFMEKMKFAHNLIQIQSWQIVVAHFILSLFAGFQKISMKLVLLIVIHFVAIFVKLIDKLIFSKIIQEWLSLKRRSVNIPSFPSFTPHFTKKWPQNGQESFNSKSHAN